MFQIRNFFVQFSTALFSDFDDTDLLFQPEHGSGASGSSKSSVTATRSRNPPRGSRKRRDSVSKSTDSPQTVTSAPVTGGAGDQDRVRETVSTESALICPKGNTDTDDVFAFRDNDKIGTSDAGGATDISSAPCERIEASAVELAKVTRAAASIAEDISDVIISDVVQKGVREATGEFNMSTAASQPQAPAHLRGRRENIADGNLLPVVRVRYQFLVISNRDGTGDWVT